MEEKQEYVNVPLIGDRDLRRAEEAVELSFYMAEVLSSVAKVIYKMGLAPESLEAERVWGCSRDMQEGLSEVGSLLLNYRMSKEFKEGEELAEQDRD